MSDDWLDQAELDRQWRAADRARAPKAADEKKKPAWLKQEFLGPCLGSTKHLITTPLLRDECRACGARVYKCHVGGMPFRLAPYHLSIEQEIAAKQAGLPTFYTFPMRGWTYAEYHDARQIKKDAERGRPPVMTTHICLGRQR